MCSLHELVVTAPPMATISKKARGDQTHTLVMCRERLSKHKPRAKELMNLHQSFTSNARRGILGEVVDRASSRIQWGASVVPHSSDEEDQTLVPFAPHGTIARATSLVIATPTSVMAPKTTLQPIPISLWCSAAIATPVEVTRAAMT